MTALIAISCAAAHADPIHDAAKAGDAKQIANLLDAGADKDASDQFGTPLHWAALMGHAEVVELLLARGANSEILSNTLGTPLHAAARRGREEVVRVLLAHGAKVDSRDTKTFTPLHLAAHEGQTRIVEMLIGAGADVNAVGMPRQDGTVLGNGEVSPLHYAVRRKHEDVTAALRAAGATPRPLEDVSARLQAANADKGREVAKIRCDSCHVIGPDDRPTSARDSGPSLIGIIGRPVATVEDFNYSPALRAFGGTWTEDRLYAFALYPMLTVPGTEMIWAPDRKADEIADVIDYLRLLTNLRVPSSLQVLRGPCAGVRGL